MIPHRLYYSYIPAGIVLRLATVYEYTTHTLLKHSPIFSFNFQGTDHNKIPSELSLDTDIALHKTASCSQSAIPIQWQYKVVIAKLVGYPPTPRGGFCLWAYAPKRGQNIGDIAGFIWTYGVLYGHHSVLFSQPEPAPKI